MKHCSLFCAGWWPFIVLPLLLLALVLFFQHRTIENRVAENTRASLDSIGADWAQINTHNRGRDVLISGTPKSLDQIEAVRDKAAQTAGVNLVEMSSDVSVAAQPLSDASLNVTINDGKVLLNGVLASQTEIDSVVTQASNTFGASNVINQLQIGDNTDQLADTTGLFGALKNQAPAISMDLVGQSITVTGEMPSSPAKQDTLSRVQSSFSGNVVDRLTIAAAPTVEIIENDVCETTIANLLSETKINFATGSATISPSSFELLENITATAKRCTGANFEVAGHTDNTGSLEGNMNLSERRAQSVVNFLLKEGLPSTQFTTAGYGPNQPIADNQTNAGRAKNRRIEFRLKN